MHDRTLTRFALPAILAGMLVDVVFLPAYLKPSHLLNRTVVVFDVLRATTTMTAAFSVGVPEIRVFDSLAGATAAADASGDPRRILCGETNAVRPPGFDLGNSPGGFTAEHAGRTVYMATTNGTKAIVAAQSAAHVLTAALVSASAAARAALSFGLDVTLLCSGTAGELSTEDVLGAGAVLSAMQRQQAGVEPAGDAGRMALRLFDSAKDSLPQVLRTTTGGRNVTRVNLVPDIDFAARLDVFDIVGQVDADPLRVVPKKF